MEVLLPALEHINSYQWASTIQGMNINHDVGRDDKENDIVGLRNTEYM